MKQLHFDYSDGGSFRAFVESVRDLAGTSADRMLFYFLSDTSDRALTRRAVDDLLQVVPDARYVGGSTGGNICDGRFVASEGASLTVVCEVFEDPATQVEVRQFPLGADDSDRTAAELQRLVAERPWVKAVGMLTTIIDVDMATYREKLGAVREDVVFFGGGVAASEDIDIFSGLPFVCSSDGEALGHAAAFVLYGGPNLHVTTEAIIGWTPFGLPLSITRADGPVLHELDGEPAFERYRHYLSIEDDELFAQNSLIFPLMIEHEGRRVLKAPLKVGEGGSLVLTSDLADYHRQCRIAYGDPATILSSIKESARTLQGFAPQGILAYSCAARLMYWGPDYVSRETLPFQAIAPTAGFYTGGEFSRDGGHVLHHNVTLVIVGLREGDAPPVPAGGDVQVNETEFSRQMAIVHSLTAFVGVMSAELSDAYRRMEELAKTDGLTGLCDRRETEQRIEAALAGSLAGGAVGAAGDGAGDAVGDAQRPSVVMIDIDDFKLVNDAYGHKAGDDVLKRLGAMLLERAAEHPGGCAGRWGGEEFMVLLPGVPLQVARQVAQRICDDFAAMDFPASGRHTLSVGVAQALPGESSDLLSQRVDKALYAAKKQGKNCVVEA